jgi:transcriptional regulator with XRE-family HTH domain
MITVFGEKFPFGDQGSQCWLSSFNHDEWGAVVYVATEYHGNEGPTIAEARQQLWTAVYAHAQRGLHDRELLMFEVFNVFSLPLQKHRGYTGIRHIRLRDGKYVSEELERPYKRDIEKYVAEAIEGTIWHNIMRGQYMARFREDGKRVKAARKAMQLGQKDFAAELGISLSTLGRMERGETETRHGILEKIDEMMARYRFTYQRLDKLADREEMLGYELAERLCDKCQKSFPVRDSYTLAPIKWGPWLEESPTLDTFKAFGPNRCKDCLPPDALEAGNFIKARKSSKPLEDKGVHGLVTDMEGESHGEL